MIINDITFNAELEDIIQELRTQLTLNGIQYLQKEPRRSGNSLQIQCPYHGNGQERKPSAGIRRTDGLFHCFVCNEVHSLQEVISYCFGHTEDYVGAWGWKWLVRNFATIQVKERKEIELDLTRLDLTHDTTQNNNDNIFVDAEELDKYRWYHPYWKKRGIIDENIIELFDLGYDKETKCITFPIRDKNGNCLFIARRSVCTKFFTYPEGVTKPLYGLYELYQSKELPKDIILCESMIDCILLWQSSYYSLALNGLGNERQFQQLRELPIRHIILATDNDEAGQKARKRIRKNVPNKIYTEIVFPDGVKDIGECTKEQLKNILQWEQF